MQNLKLLLLWLCMAFFTLRCSAPTKEFQTSPSFAATDISLTATHTTSPQAAEATGLPGALPTPYPIPTLVTPAAQGPPLNTNSTPEEVRLRAQNPSWHTMWIDGSASVLTFDGTQSGSFHAQAWIDRFGGGQALSTDQLDDLPKDIAEASPRWAWLSNGETVSLYDLVTGDHEPKYYRWFTHPLESAGIVAEMVSPHFVENLGDHPIIGEEQVAGRPTVIIDLDHAHFWLDAKTGVVLRYQNFSNGKITTEVVINSIAYDLSLPAEAQLGFVSNQISFDKGPAPPEHDFSNSTLEIESAMFGDPEQYAETFLVDLYGDDYFLGSVPTGAAPLLRCSRSADGSKIVFSYLQMLNSSQGRETVRWFALANVNQVYDPLPDLSLLSPVAWVPDNQHLVFSGCDAEGNCGLHLFDTIKEQTIWTRAGDFGAPLPIWNPDGTKLAVVGNPTEAGLLTLQVLAFESGTLLYEGTFDPDTEKAPVDAPIHDWGVEIPTSYSGYGNCTAPP
ncbi:MAG: hypothetical protein DWQ07_01435 [Chloroflexi bacterium]|nr:MAG: hypothetical protein DWQ07_01435 [Chloroflexota bacterium]MBL1193841.1 hypothetical protein [Chloroflexota bacterium]NOH11135.1 hypothetical protein [Chloroflexota bacterium]